MKERPDRCLLCEARYSNPVCRMSADHLAHFAALTTLSNFEPGQALFMQGDPARDVFLIRSGQVKLVHVHTDGAEQIVRTAGPGETLGVGADLERGMSVSAIASGATHVCRIPLARVESLALEDPEFSLAWIHLLNDEIRRSRDALLNLGPQPAAQRLARYLLKSSRAGAEAGRSSRGTHRARKPGECIAVRTTHADLGKSLSIAQETTTRLLGALEEMGVLKLSRGRIEILDLDRLAALAGYPGSKLESA